MAQSLEERLAFCSWSVQPTSADELIAKAEQIGIKRVQLAMDPLRAEGGPGEAWADAGRRFADAGIRYAGAMFGAVGEDYTTIESIHRTGGIVPDETWPATWENFQKMMPMVHDLGISYVAFHAGFIPEAGDPVFDKVAGRLQQVADLAAQHGVTVGLETGQEAAATLKAFLQTAGRANLGINFDPANMILYGSGDPIAALKLLMPYVKQVHIKDATASANPGKDWGEEVVTGTGQVDWNAFFQVLRENKYEGYLSIEREAGNQRVEDIRAAKQFLLKNFA